MKNYIDLKNNNDYNKLVNAGNIIKTGGLVIFPTETVYAIGANGLDENAVKKIFLAKGRNFNNPINLLVSDITMIETVAKDISPLEYNLIKAFFPGPLTIILKKRNIVPDIVTANNSTVGIRMPANTIAQKLIQYSGVPIAAPSANISGKISGTSFADIYNDFKNSVDYFVDGGNSQIGIESTIVKVIDNSIHILRPGSITDEQLHKYSQNIICDYEDLNSKNTYNSNHYMPNSNCILVFSKDNEKMVSEIKKIAIKYSNPCILSSHENLSFYNCKSVIDIGSKYDLNEIARNIFLCLRNADKLNPDIIIIEGLAKKGLGTAIMNRLIKACKNNYINL